MKTLKPLIQLALLGIAIYLGMQLYKSVQLPIEFDKIKDARYEKVVVNLKEIRKAQNAYKDKYGQFTASWDTLINFIDTDSIASIRKIGALTDEQIDGGMTEAEGIKLGILIRDTAYIPAKISLYGSADYPSQDIKYVPNLKDKVEFGLGADKIKTSSGVIVPVFCAKAHNNTIFGLVRDASGKVVSLEIGEDYEQEIINLDESRRVNGMYPGLKVGSLEEANNSAGNWE